MALSPNYGWSEPDNSSLVKNGAADIRTLGDAIDTSVWNVGFGQAGKNKIINGDFRVNQRQFTSTTSETYTFDRMFSQLTNGGGSVTFSAQTFTPGAAPVTGYEAINFLQIVTAGQSGTDSRAMISNRIEDVRTFANQTATFSFWIKANTGTPNVNISLRQFFGSGGSSTVFTPSTPKAITTSWARYSFTINVPSVSGKTITSDSNLGVSVVVSSGSNNDATLGAVGVQNNTFQIWGLQAEAGSKATPFQTASGGSPQAELAMCQRYYYRIYPNEASRSFGPTVANAATGTISDIPFPVTMRIRPTALEQSGTASDYSVVIANTSTNCSAVPAYGAVTNQYFAGLSFTVASGLTNGQAGRAISASANAYLGWSAEL